MPDKNVTKIDVHTPDFTISVNVSDGKKLTLDYKVPTTTMARAAS